MVIAVLGRVVHGRGSLVWWSIDPERLDERSSHTVVRKCKKQRGKRSHGERRMGCVNEENEEIQLEKERDDWTYGELER